MRLDMLLWRSFLARSSLACTARFVSACCFALLFLAPLFFAR
jgi:hypothetical protein